MSREHEKNLGSQRPRRRKKARAKRLNEKMQGSLFIVVAIVMVLFLVLVIRIMYLNNTKGEEYSQKVSSQQTSSQTSIQFQRGDIVDRNGTVLAKSVKVYNLVIDSVVMQTERRGEKAYIEPTKRTLQEVFGIEPEEIEQVLEEYPKSQYYVFKKGLSFEDVEKFKEIQENNDFVKGVWFEDDYIRTYPNGSLASHVLGFTFSGNVGNSGIEGQYNEYLNGTNGSRYSYYTADNEVETTIKYPENGNTIVSTIDANIQQIVEKHIQQFEEEFGSKTTSVIVADPNSGEILAMANSGAYDPNNPTDLTGFYTEQEIASMSEEERSEAWNQVWRNFIISDSFEPGSTIKALTIAMALDEGLVTEDSMFVCTGKIQVGGRYIRCARRTGHGEITLEEVLAYSCNVGIMEIAESLGRTIFATYQENFNLGKKTGIDLPGEASGLVYSEDKLNAQELATSAFGQSMSIPMIQVLSSFSAVINGGYYYTPHVVKQIKTESGAIIKNVSENYVKQIVSESTSDLVREYMMQTVENGTAQKAKIEGYSIGGKTGTAEKLPRGDGRYVLSFIGYAPVENPQVVVYVVVDEPQNVVKQDDSGIACIIARDIMSEIFPFLNIYPSVTSEEEEGISSYDASGDTGNILGEEEEEETTQEESED